jgi:transcriptional regulator with XRE-family HTH domain
MGNTYRMNKHILREYREQHDLTQHQLADMLGCSASMVAHIENEFRNISPERAIAWEPILGIPKEKLCPRIFAVAA